MPNAVKNDENLAKNLALRAESKKNENTQKSPTKSQNSAQNIKNRVNVISEASNEKVPELKIPRQKVLIRADSSSKIGHGHIMRDLVLAKRHEAVGESVSFACRRLKGNLNKQIPYEVFILETMEISELIELVNEEKFDLVIIDHYGISYDDEWLLKRSTKARVMCLDDEVKAHFCDILLNPNPYAKASLYDGLVNEYCELRCGFSHSLIRDEFFDEAKITREKIYDLFICFGGTDVQNLSAKTAKAEIDKRIFIATTSANANLDELKSIAKKHKNITLGVDEKNLAIKMNESKKLIISASSLVNEALILKADFKAICTASNQLKIAQWLKASGKEVEFSY